MRPHQNASRPNVSLSSDPRETRDLGVRARMHNAHLSVHLIDGNLPALPPGAVVYTGALSQDVKAALSERYARGEISLITDSVYMPRVRESNVTPEQPAIYVTGDAHAARTLRERQKADVQVGLPVHVRIVETLSDLGDLPTHALVIIGTVTDEITAELTRRQRQGSIQTLNLGNL